MQENFERYRSELDQVRLTSGSKKALTESLRRRKIPEKPEIRTRRVSAGLGKIAAAAAIVCLVSVLSVAAVAKVVGDPTLGNAFHGDQAGYDQSSGIIGRSVERDGWTITITDCVGDDFQAFLGLEVEAPEGTVLDAEHYEIYADNEYGRQGVPGTLNGFFYSLPDDDPADNRIHMIYDWYTTRGESNHVRMRLSLIDLVENHGYLWDEKNWDRRMVKEGRWDFGWINIDYADNALRFAPMVTIPDSGLESDLVLSEVVISPVGMYLHFDGPEPYYANWVDNWYMPCVYDTIRIFDVDGNEITLSDGLFYGPERTYRSFTSSANAMSDANCDEPAELNLVDLDRVAAISVAGIIIPVQ